MNSNILIFCIISLAIVVKCEVFDISNLKYQSYKHMHKFCICDNFTNSSDNSNISIIYPNIEYNYQEYNIVKIFNNNCVSLNMDTDYKNIFHYSYDLVNWKQKNGFSLICPSNNILYLNITSKFILYTSEIKIQPMTILTIDPNFNYIYNYSSYNDLGIYVSYNDSKCSNMDIKIAYNNTIYHDKILNVNNINGYLSNETISITNTNNYTCFAEVRFSYSNDLYISNYTSNLYFYNNKSINNHNYILADGIDIVSLNGYDSTIPSILKINKSDDEMEYEVYLQIISTIYSNNSVELSNNILSMSINNTTDYIKPFYAMLYRTKKNKVIDIVNQIVINNITIKSDKNMIIEHIYPYENLYLIKSEMINIVSDCMSANYNDSYLLDTNICALSNVIIKNGYLNITKNLEDKSLIISNSSVEYINITLYNLVLNGTNIFYIDNTSIVNIKNCLNISGNLKVEYKNNPNDIIELFRYNCINGKFDNIEIVYNNTKINHCDKYLQSSLQITIGSCEFVDMTLIIGVSVTIIIVIMVVAMIIIMYNVKCINEKIFPYANRKKWIHK